MKTALLSLVSLLLLAGCATPRMQTASGKPETSISGASKETVRTALANEFLNNGFQVQASGDPMVMIFEKDASLGMSMLFGSMLNPTARERLQASILDQGTNAVRIIVTPYIVSNPRSAVWEHEREHYRAFPRIDYMLQCIKADLEGTPRPDKPIEPPPPKTIAGARAMQ